MQQEIERERRRIRERVTTEALEALADEALPTVRRLVGLRDQDESLPTALGAANAILDRVVPKTQRVEDERTIRIVLDAEALTQMRDALVEDGVLEHEVLGEPLPEEPAQDVPQLLSLDRAMAQAGDADEPE